VSQVKEYRGRMNSKRRTGYGVYDITRQVARRLQQEWEAVENPPHFGVLAGARFPTGPRPLAVAISSEPPREKEKRPLAA
jgi:hypothetical protein